MQATPRPRWLLQVLALVACVSFVQASAAATFGFDDVTAVARGIAAKPYKEPEPRTVAARTARHEYDG